MWELSLHNDATKADSTQLPMIAVRVDNEAAPVEGCQPPTAAFQVEQQPSQSLMPNFSRYKLIPESQSGTHPLSTRDEDHVWQCTDQSGKRIYIFLSQQPILVTLDAPGPWTVRLTVVDQAGCVASAQQTLATQLPRESPTPPPPPPAKRARFSSKPMALRWPSNVTDDSGEGRSRWEEHHVDDVKPTAVTTPQAVSQYQPKQKVSSDKKLFRKRCGSCKNCVKLQRKDVCGKCSKCLHKLQGFVSSGACMERKCLALEDAVASTSASPQLSKSEEPLPIVKSSPSISSNSKRQGTKIPNRCGNCENCRKLLDNDVCGTCSNCKRKLEGKVSTGACLQRKCVWHAAKGDQSTSRNIAASAGRKESKTSSCPCDVVSGNKVYAKWSDNDQYYWGTVTKEFECLSAKLFNVRFDDGDVRNRVPLRDLWYVDQFICNMTSDFGDDFAKKYFQKTSGLDFQTYHDIRQTASASDVMTPSQEARACLCAKLIKRHWIDFSFTPRTITGVVKSCCTRPVPSVEVQYCSADLKSLKEAIPDWDPYERDSIAMELAKGFREDYDEEHRDIIFDDSKACRWIVPTSVKDDPSNDQPSRVLEVMGVSIELQARDSEIPDAGWGVFMRVKPNGTTEERFVLEPGHMIDLGIYSPYRTQDNRHETVLVVKDFIFDGKTEQWVFDSFEDEDSSCNHHYGFDITNDSTGELHEQAKRNVLVYVNETDGVEHPTVKAFRDPFHFVHYLLSHQNGLELEYDKWIELKIDYGERYERTRVAKGYSRLSKDSEEYQRLKKDSLAHTTLDDMKDWDLPEILSAWKYIAELDLDALYPGYMWRCLLVTLFVFNSAIAHKYGNDSSGLATLFSEAKFVILGMLRRVPDGDLSTAVADNEYVVYLCRYLSLPVEYIQKMPTSELRKILKERVEAEAEASVCQELII